MATDWGRQAIRSLGVRDKVALSHDGAFSPGGDTAQEQETELGKYTKPTNIHANTDIACNLCALETLCNFNFRKPN